MSTELNAHIDHLTRELLALKLWHAGAVRANLTDPFKLASGNFSPVYFNCRRVISNPAFMQFFTAATMQIVGNCGIGCQAVAGGETAGIPFAAYVAQALGRPMMYVRKAVKGHGIGSLVEGGDPTGKTVLLVEDLITDAGSKKHFIDALRAVGGEVRDVLVLFDRQQGGAETLAGIGIKLHSVTDLTAALNVARNYRLLSESELVSISAYLNNPKVWHQERGLQFLE